MARLGSASHRTSGASLRPQAVSGLAVALLGSAVPRVRAVHASGLSLVAPGRSDVCWLGTIERGLLPLHLVLRRRQLDDLLRRVEIGEPLPLDLAGVRVFELQLPVDTGPLSGPALAQVASWLRNQPRPCGLGTPIAEALAPAARVRSTLAGVAEGCADVDAALRALVGRGAGSSPAGDDVLVGALAHGLSTSGAATPLAQALRRLSPEFDGLTTAVGATYLRAALAGSFAGDLLGFVRTLRQAPIERAVRLAMRVAAHGATSGIDTLIGFVGAHEHALAAPDRAPPLR